MTRERARALIGIIEAFIRGETIQIENPDGAWSDCETPAWSNGVRYRVKPKPREWYERRSHTCDMPVTVHATLAEAKAHNEESGTLRILHVREVLE